MLSIELKFNFYSIQTLLLATIHDPSFCPGLRVGTPVVCTSEFSELHEVHVECVCVCESHHTQILNRVKCGGHSFERRMCIRKAKCISLAIKHTFMTSGVSHCDLAIYIKMYLKTKRRIMKTQIFHHVKI